MHFYFSFGKLIRTRYSGDINIQKKTIRNNYSIDKAKKGGYKRVPRGSAHSLKCITKRVRKRIRTRKRHRANRLSFRRKYFWTHNAYAKKRMKKTNVKCTSIGLSNSTKPNTSDGRHVQVVNETKQTKTKYLTQMGVSFPVLTMLNSLPCALNTETNSGKQIASRTGKTV